MAKAESNTEKAEKLVALAKELRLSDRQRRFAEAWVADPEHNGMEAARKAGYTGNNDTVKTRACKLLRHEDVQKYIAALEDAAGIRERQIEGTTETLVTIERVLQEMARIAFFNPKQLYDENGALKHPKDWPDDVAAAIAGMEVVKKNLVVGDGLSDDVMKPKAWDKPKALEMLAKTLAMFKDKVEHTGGVAFRWMGDDEDA